MSWLFHTLPGKLLLVIFALLFALATAIGLIVTYERAGNGVHTATSAATAAKGAAEQAAHSAQLARAQCNLDFQVASAPLTNGPTGSPSVLSLKLIAGGRVAYIDAECALGPLAPADERLYPYLPTGAKYRQ